MTQRCRIMIQKKLKGSSKSIEKRWRIKNKKMLLLKKLRKKMLKKKISRKKSNRLKNLNEKQEAKD